MSNLAENMQNATKKSKQFVASKMFDFIAACLIITMLALTLGVVELREITLLGVANIFLECIPFFITAVLLSVNFYTKGSFVGKNTDKFTAIVSQYSSLVDSLSGEDIDILPEFCKEYNHDALRKMQEPLLRTAAISYEYFEYEHCTTSGTKVNALKVLSKEELLHLYSKEQVKIILKAKKIKVKGIHNNIILGNTNNSDITDIGEDEKTLNNNNTFQSAIRYIISTFLLSLIGVKDVLLWGWAGLLLTAFKLGFILCSSMMKYFSGYNDITIKLSNHIARKIDIIKQFKAWITDRQHTQANTQDSNND